MGFPLPVSSYPKGSSFVVSNISSLMQWKGTLNWFVERKNKNIRWWQSKSNFDKYKPLLSPVDIVLN